MIKGGLLKSNLNVKSIVIAIILIPFLLIVAKSFSGDKFMQNMLFMMFLYAGLASSWNIVGGYAGQLSLGHAAFFGIGAYTSTLLLLNFQVIPWMGMAVGALIAVIAAFIIGYPCFRLRGPFFTLATLAIGEVLRIAAIEWRGVNCRGQWSCCECAFTGLCLYDVFHKNILHHHRIYIYAIMHFRFESD